MSKFYQHKTVQDHNFADTPQLPDRFTKLGETVEDGVTYIHIYRDGEKFNGVTKIEKATFDENFEALPE